MIVTYPASNPIKGGSLAAPSGYETDLSGTVTDVRTVAMWIYFDATNIYELSLEAEPFRFSVDMPNRTLGVAFSDSGYKSWVNGQPLPGGPVMAHGMTEGYHLIAAQSALANDTSPIPWSFGYNGWAFIYDRILTDAEHLQLFNATNNHYPVQLTGDTPPEYILDVNHQPTYA